MDNRIYLHAGNKPVAFSTLAGLLAIPFVREFTRHRKFSRFVWVPHSRISPMLGTATLLAEYRKDSGVTYRDLVGNLEHPLPEGWLSVLTSPTAESEASKPVLITGPTPEEFVQAIFQKRTYMVPSGLELHAVFLPHAHHQALLDGTCVTIVNHPEEENTANVGDLVKVSRIPDPPPADVFDARNLCPFLVLVTHIEPVGDNLLVFSVRKIRITIAGS